MNLFEEVDIGLDGLAQLRTLIRSGRKLGISRSLGFELVEVEAGRAVFAGTPGEHAYNPIGTVHGGYAATLLDSACGCAVHSQLTAKRAYTTPIRTSRTTSQSCVIRARCGPRGGCANSESE